MILNENKYRRVKIAMLALFIASLPFHMQVSNVILIIAVGFSLIPFFADKDAPWKKINKLSIGFAAYFLLEIIGLLYTDNIHVGLSTIERHLSFLFIPLMFIDIEISVKERIFLFEVFILSCFLGTLVCIGSGVQASLQVYNQFFNDWMFSHDRFSEAIGMQAVYLAIYIGLCLFVLLNEIVNNFSTLSTFRRIAYIVLIVFFLAIVVLTGARTAILSIILIVSFNLLLYAWLKKSFKAVVFSLAVPLVFVFFILSQPTIRIRFMDLLKTNYSETNYGSYFARTKIWAPSIEAIGENFWIGTGIGDSQTELDKKFAKYDYTEAIDNYNSHNQYLDTQLQLGVVGSLVFILIFTVQWVRCFANMDWLYGSFLGFVMLQCMTESILNRNKGILFFLIFGFILYKTKSKPYNG